MANGTKPKNQKIAKWRFDLKTQNLMFFEQMIQKIISQLDTFDLLVQESGRAITL